MFLKIIVILKIYSLTFLFHTQLTYFLVLLLIICSSWSPIWNFKPASISSVFTSFNSRFFCIFFNFIQFQINLIRTLILSNFSPIEANFPLNWSNLSFIKALISSKQVLLLELLSFIYLDIFLAYTNI